MITASDVKNYLRIDYTDDDALITSAIQAGYDYLTDAIDDFALLYSSNTVFARKADMWVLCHYLPPMYDQREGMFTGKAAEMDYGARALLTQLQLYIYPSTTDSVDVPEPEPEPEPDTPDTPDSPDSPDDPNNTETEENENDSGT